MENLTEMLGQELADQVQEKIGKEKLVFAKDYVPISRITEMSEQNNELKKINDNLSTSVSKLEKSAGASEQLKAELTGIVSAHDATIAEYDAKLANMKKTNAIDIAMMESKVKNSKAVKALIDMEKISLDNGNLIGLSTQIEALKKSDGYLFHTEEQEDAPNGDDNGGDFDGKTKGNPFAKDSFNMIEAMRMYKDNPVLAAKLEKEASTK